jgi:hypothetical protein
MNKLEFTAWPATCAVCDKYGELVLCEDCGAEIHIVCGEYHECEEG